MTTTLPIHHTREKALQLGIPEETLSCALNIIYPNRHLVNALDKGAEMDDYIYKALLKQTFAKKKAEAEAGLDSRDAAERTQASKDLSVLSREELTTDPFYRAVLPLMVKVLAPEPILRLHAETASTVILSLADFKRKHRATSLTEIIVKHFAADLHEVSA